VEQVLGYSAEYLYAHPLLWNESIHPDDRSSVGEVVHEFEGGNFFDIEYRIRDAQGNWHWLRDRSIGRNIGDGEVFIEGVATDITERKKAEESLRESEQRYRLATNAGLTAVWRADLLTGYVESGGTLERLIGYEPSDVAGNEGWWLEATHPDDREQGLDAWQDCSEGKKDRYDIVHRIYHKDGSIHWLEIRAQGIRNSEGHIVAIAGTTRDITERKQAEEKLLAEQAFRNSIELSLSSGIVIVDNEGCQTYVNPYFCKLFGWTEEELTGKTAPFAYWATDQLEAIGEAFQLTLANKAAKEGFELEFVRKDGVRIPVQVFISPFSDGKQREGWLANVIDITERKRAEEKLQQSEIRFRNFFINAPVGVNGFDSEGKVISVNSVARKYFGVSEDDPLIGYRLFEDPSISDETKWKIKHGQVATEERYIDFRAIQQHGMYKTSKTEQDKIFIKLTYTPYGANINNPEGFIAIIQDISERKQAEEEIIKSQKLLKEFASYLQNVREEERILLAREIHDELAQILIAVKIDMGLIKNKLLKGIENVDPENLMTSFTELSEKVDNTIKTSRKIMSGLRSEELEVIGLLETLKQDTIDFQKRTKIHCLFETDLQAININPKQSVTLLRICQEALSNVLKHAKATSVKITLKVENGQLILEIVDNGLGFDQTKKSRSDSYGMIGMKERVLLLDGELQVTSLPKQGTSVRVEIPYLNK
jgi:PAS domain S-box-containing protein